MLLAPGIAPISFGEVGEQNPCFLQSIAAEIGVGAL